AGVIAVQGSAAVSQALRATPDSIAYVDFNRFVDDGLAGVALKNADGQFVGASVDSLHEAVTHSGWFTQGDFLADLADQHGAKSWPITMGIFVAVPRVPAQPERAERALRFLTWAYLHGDALARQARFVPLPDKVQASAYREIAKVRNARGESLGALLNGAD
ncbi:MAG TPA: phosphate ABC transporter substrate-binding protein PstS, partial [Burkholderiaceae bacterium]